MDNQSISKKSRQAAIISLFGFLIVVIAFLLAGSGIKNLSQEKESLLQEKENLNHQVDSLSDLKEQLHVEYVALVKGFGWTEKQIREVSAEDPRFIDAVRSINEIRTLLGSFQSNPRSSNMDQLHVTYTMMTEDFGSIEQALSTINIETQYMPSVNDEKTDVGINQIRFAPGTLPNDIRIVAYSLLSAGIEINSIQMDNTLLPNTMELGVFVGENLTRISAEEIKATQSF